MLPALTRVYRASRLRHDTDIHLLNKLRYFATSQSAPSQQNPQEEKNRPFPTDTDNSTLATPPPEPAPEECCGKGCEECVWTVYWNQLREYQIAVADAQGIERQLDPFEILELQLAERNKGKT
jgi:hypothetical protein